MTFDIFSCHFSSIHTLNFCISHLYLLIMASDTKNPAKYDNLLQLYEEIHRGQQKLLQLQDTRNYIESYMKKVKKFREPKVKFKPQLVEKISSRGKHQPSFTSAKKKSALKQPKNYPNKEIILNVHTYSYNTGPLKLNTRIYTGNNKQKMEILRTLISTIKEQRHMNQPENLKINEEKHAQLSKQARNALEGLANVKKMLRHY